MAFEDEINYEKVRKINEKEKKSSKLSNIALEFYPALISHLNKLQEEYNKKYLKTPTSTEALLLNNEICKLDDIIKKIYNFRERKILLQAWQTGGVPDTKNMLEHEQKLYKAVVEVLNGYRDEVLLQKPNPVCVKTEYIEITGTEPETSAQTENDQNTVTTPVPASGVEMTESQSEPEQELVSATDITPDTEDETFEEDPDKIIVHVLEDLEPFVGTDLVTYNLHKEDLITLPKQNAEILLKNNKVKVIVPNI